MKVLLLILAHRLRLVYWRVTRPVLLGVRVLMVQDGEVLLVRHSYQPEWFLPGGGLKRGETTEQAARREAREEVGAELGPVSIFDVDTSLEGGVTLHNVVFLCREYRLVGEGDAEIAEQRLFPLNHLPGDISQMSRRRIEKFREAGR